MGPDEKILKYMREQNRPYSATDVLNNLHKEIGKTQVVKSLETLAGKGELTEKVYGKQKIYFLNQDKLPSLGEGELKQMEESISSKSRNLNSLREETRALDSQLGSLRASLTTAQAKERVVELGELLEKGKEKLARLKEACKDIQPEDKARINKEHVKLTKEWRKRKRMCMDVINTILENDGCTKSKEELLEEMGVETDEAVNAKLPESGA